MLSFGKQLNLRAKKVYFSPASMTRKKKKQEKTKGELSSSPKLITPLPRDSDRKDSCLEWLFCIWQVSHFFLSFSKVSDPACYRLSRGTIKLKGTLIPTILKNYLWQTVLKIMDTCFHPNQPIEVILSKNSHLCLFRIDEEEIDLTLQQKVF